MVYGRTWPAVQSHRPLGTLMVALVVLLMRAQHEVALYGSSYLAGLDAHLFGLEATLRGVVG